MCTAGHGYSVSFPPCLLALGKKIEAPAQLQELVSDLSSRFVFSPPALRTRRKATSHTPRAGEELVSNALHSCAFLNKPLGKAQALMPKAPGRLVCTWRGTLPSDTVCHQWCDPGSCGLDDP